MAADGGASVPDHSDFKEHAVTSGTILARKGPSSVRTGYYNFVCRPFSSQLLGDVLLVTESGHAGASMHINYLVRACVINPY